MESLERPSSLNNNHIAEREIFFLGFAEGVFLAGIADADGPDYQMTWKGS